MPSLVQYHPRSFCEFRYVYPVVSRRSGGLSIGVNLSPNRQCNFSCVYCQVIAEEDQQKQINKKSDFVDCIRVESELRQLISMINDGSLFQDHWFSRLSDEKRILKDIAFSGDGEPTLAAAFSDAIKCVTNIRKQLCDDSVKIVLITNGTMLHSKHIQNSLEIILENNGEIWTKLDAGTPEFFKKISRSSIKYEQILNNLKELTKRIPIVIQSCFLSIDGQSPNESEIKQYSQRLLSFHTNNIIRIQIYTAARNTPENWALPLSNEQLDSIADTVRNITKLQVDTFYSS
ncbi:MAG: radical SAM protein [Planctomycetaceae bacterium]|jgi:wyosine [tRNA(Phe)-imidazoG37] synthetase (radical SAM superfamily)|nr:radical SAM protein [Planctomycetaceae bacterium]